jgi:hypothetical protein
MSGSHRWFIEIEVVSLGYKEKSGRVTGATVASKNRCAGKEEERLDFSSLINQWEAFFIASCLSWRAGEDRHFGSSMILSLFLRASLFFFLFSLSGHSLTPEESLKMGCVPLARASFRSTPDSLENGLR